LPWWTRAPAFPRLRRSGLLFHPGAGRVFSVTFRVARTARLTFTIRTRRGTLVRRFRAGARRRGTVIRFNWDGRDRRGRLVRAGLYRFTVTATARRYHRTARGTVRLTYDGAIQVLPATADNSIARGREVEIIAVHGMAVTVRSLPPP